MKYSDSSETDSTGGLGPRARRAFDILATDHENLGLAVSGGSDSLALLVLAHDWARANGRRIEVATVDHGLRPEARAEAEGVAETCRQLGIEHSILTWRRPEAAAGAGQAEARRARHGLLATWARERNLTLLALGHTRDDRIETFLMRARQGSGWHGLAGLLPAGPSPVWPEGRGVSLIRPLLAFTRAELREELACRDVTWSDDPSNEALRYERVRARALAARLPREARDRIIRIMCALCEARAAALAAARDGLNQCRAAHAAAHVPAHAIACLNEPARSRLVEARVMTAGGADVFPRRDALERVTAGLSEQAGLAGGVTLAGAWIRQSGGKVTISRAPARRGSAEAAAPAWDRAAALLADPKLEALSV